MSRSDIAEYVGAVFGVYGLIVIAWVVISFIFSLGGRLGTYSRVVTAVIDFLRDCSEPYLRVFRRLGLNIGPLDLSPMVAIIVLQVVGALVVGAIEPG